MACVGSLNIEKDIRAAKAVMKQPTRLSVYAAHDNKYRRLLTSFAFEKYMTQSAAVSSVTFIQIDENFAASGSSSNRVITRPLHCDCEFFSSMGIVCKHILSFRLHNGLNLFDEQTCLSRWTHKLFDGVLSIDYSTEISSTIESIQTQKKRNRKKTYNEKYRETKNTATHCAH